TRPRPPGLRRPDTGVWHSERATRSPPGGPVPNHPPIDPEFAVALAAPGVLPPSLHPQDIPARRSARVIDREHLRRAGAITLTEREIPGPADNPTITVLVLSPADRPDPTAGPGPGIVFV